MKNKICFLSSSFQRWDPRIFLRQARSLANNGFDVSFIVCDGKSDEIIDNVNILTSGFQPQNRFQRFFLTKKYLFKKAIAIDAAIYQISEPELISLGLKLKRAGKKVIFDMREDYPRLILSKEYLPRFLRKTISLIIAQYINFSLKKYDLLISVTPELVAELKKINKNSILVASYPVIRDILTGSFEDYKKRNNIICYIGTIYRISRQEVLLKAVEKINDLEYIIAGKMESEQYQSELFSLPYWKKIKFIDGISREEILDLYQKVTIGNSLRDFRGTGYEEGSLGIIKIFEYMEAALPIICSDVKIWREIVEKYNCGICVNPNNEDEIQIALQFLIDHKEEAYKMGQNARRAVIEEFNWDTQEKIYVNAMKKLF